MTSFSPPFFDQPFLENLQELFQWRRDVRRFLKKPIPEELVTKLFDSAQFAPSVGNSQPWRWVRIESKEKRAALKQNYEACRKAGSSLYKDQQAELYEELKLAGFDNAPLQLAVFCDITTQQGFGLGKQTMPETLEYSVVSMITLFWLQARALGLGLGWVSVIDAQKTTALLEVPEHWKLIACLCVGWPEQEIMTPELETAKWQERTQAGRQILIR